MNMSKIIRFSKKFYLLFLEGTQTHSGKQNGLYTDSRLPSSKYPHSLKLGAMYLCATYYLSLSSLYADY